MLVTELLKKMQFRHNETQLQELDDESVDDDVKKIIHKQAKQHFIKRPWVKHFSCELICRVLSREFPPPLNKVIIITVYK